MEESLVRYADMLSAMGTESRLRIIRLLLAAHPDGMTVGAVQAEMGMPASTLSHHLDKLKSESLVTVRREGTFLRYTANIETLHDLLTFLYAECCSLAGSLTLPCFTTGMCAPGGSESSGAAAESTGPPAMATVNCCGPATGGSCGPTPSSGFEAMPSNCCGGDADVRRFLEPEPCCAPGTSCGGSPGASHDQTEGRCGPASGSCCSEESSTNRVLTREQGKEATP